MIIHYHDGPCPMTVYVTMLLSHEIRLDRANQIPITEPYGNGQGLPITSIIPTTFQSSLKPYTTLTLYNLLLLLKLTKNLISVSQFTKDNHVYFEFHPYACLVKSQATYEVLLQGSIGKEKLYSFGQVQSTHTDSNLKKSSYVLTLTNTTPNTKYLSFFANKSVIGL